MKLVIKHSEKDYSLFIKEEAPNYIDEKLHYYDYKKLQEWEQRYNEILKILYGAKNQDGIKLLFALAEEGYPDARWLLSDMYLKGKGLTESFQKAVEWDRRAKVAEKYFRDKLFNN